MWTNLSDHFVKLKNKKKTVSELWYYKEKDMEKVKENFNKNE